MRDGDTNKKGKIKSFLKSPPGGDGSRACVPWRRWRRRRAVLLAPLTLGCWPNRRTGGSGSAGPVRVSPGCHLRGRWRWIGENRPAEGPGTPPSPRKGCSQTTVQAPAGALSPRTRTGTTGPRLRGFLADPASRPQLHPRPEPWPTGPTACSLSLPSSPQLLCPRPHWGPAQTSVAQPLPWAPLLPPTILPSTCSRGGGTC